MDDLIQFNKYFTNIKKEENLQDSISGVLNYKNKDIKLNDEHLSIIFTKFIKSESMQDVYKLLEIVSS